MHQVIVHHFREAFKPGASCPLWPFSPPIVYVCIYTACVCVCISVYVCVGMEVGSDLIQRWVNCNIHLLLTSPPPLPRSPLTCRCLPAPGLPLLLPQFFLHLPPLQLLLLLDQLILQLKHIQVLVYLWGPPWSFSLGVYTAYILYSYMSVCTVHICVYSIYSIWVCVYRNSIYSIFIKYMFVYSTYV